MSVQDKILSFLNSPFPLWETELTTMLVEHEWQKQFENGIDQLNYTTASSYFKNVGEIESNNVLLSGNTLEDCIYLEYPSFKKLGNFYEEHGLEPELEINIGNEQIQKLQAALTILDLVPGVKDCISLLVKRIQVLRQDDEEIDTSYSHPEIPFTIFVSLCKDDSMISNLRVAESILHEAMHLKLTLIEKHIDLIVANSKQTFYSPWRDEQRPVRGVLHGLFVFSAIKEFYMAQLSNFSKNRISEILINFSMLNEFIYSKGLTKAGGTLVKGLV